MPGGGAAAPAAAGAGTSTWIFGSDLLGGLVGQKTSARLRAIAVADRHPRGAAGVGPVDLAAGETAPQGHLTGH